MRITEEYRVFQSSEPQPGKRHVRVARSGGDGAWRVTVCLFDGVNVSTADAYELAECLRLAAAEAARRNKDAEKLTRPKDA